MSDPRRLYFDTETFSAVDLPKTGVYRYAEDASTLVLMAAYAVDDEPVRVAVGHDEIAAIPGLWDDDVTKVCHNSSFDRVIASRIAWDTGRLPRHEYLDPRAWDCTMTRAAEHGLPQSLDKLARAVGATEKDSAGTRLIGLFSKPTRDGGRNTADDKPDEWEAFCRYCAQDVETLREVDRLVPGWPTRAEREAWWADQAINDRGIRVDVPMAVAAVAASEANRERHGATFAELTGGVNPRSGPQMIEWLAGHGVTVADVRKETVDGVLASPGVDPVVRRALLLRQGLVLATSSKYVAAVASVSDDGRLRGTARFYGAHTGRWAGRGVQLQNLSREAMPSKTAEDAAILDLALGLGASDGDLKRLVRQMLILDGTVVDYSAIEARVLAWLAGEQWVLDAFTDGQDIYVATADRMGGLTRQEGKVATLALGYGGGVGALRVMGYGRDLPDEKVQPLVTAWRKANPRIARLWRDLEAAFRDGGKAGQRLAVTVDGNRRLVRLPSGRALTYHGVKADPDTGRLSFADPRGHRADTYGGRLVENVTQAVARDLLAHALVTMERHGLRVVAHVHDEVLVEDTRDVELVERLMSDTPAWAGGLPVRGEGGVTYRYRKG